MNDGGMTIPEGSLTVFDVDRPDTASAVSELMLLMQAVTEHYSMCVHSASEELIEKMQNPVQVDSTAKEVFDEKILEATTILDGHRLWLMDEIRNLNKYPHSNN